MALHVDIFSDVICPWCFIGKRRLETAIAALHGRQEVTVTWRPFQLNPDMPREGIDRKAYRSAKFGSWEKSLALDEQIAAVGATEDIPFAHDRMLRTPNTLDAHRLIRLAQREGVQDAVVERLFVAYFVEGEDVGERRTLAEIASAAGLDARRVELFLDSDEDEAAVRAEEAEVRARGAVGVPLCVINEKYAVSGAQPAELLLAALEKAAALDSTPRLVAAAVGSTSSTCSVPGPEAC